MQGAGDQAPGPRIRQALAEESEQLAKLWYDGWQDAHTDILPSALAQQRTYQSFLIRMRAGIEDVRTAEIGSAVAGFSMRKADELYQFYVAAAARGTGVAAALMSDAVEQFRNDGIDKIWLACAIGNERAARFYEKSGWQRAGVMTSHLDTPSGPFALDVWKYEFVVPFYDRAAR